MRVRWTEASIKNNARMRKYEELSEKERFLREIIESARIMREKRELFNREASIGRCTHEEFSLVIVEKGGLI